MAGNEILLNSEPLGITNKLGRLGKRGIKKQFVAKWDRNKKPRPYKGMALKPKC
jgi:hypothetical protein